MELRRATHRAIQAVTDDLNALRFNRAVAQIYTLANAITAASAVDRAVMREALETIVLLSQPDDAPSGRDLLGASGPHDAGRRMRAGRPPRAGCLVSDTITIAVQVNGKVRGEITIPQGRGRGNRRNRRRWRWTPVKRLLDGKPPRRIIVVPGRIVNVVV